MYQTHFSGDKKKKKKSKEVFNNAQMIFKISTVSQIKSKHSITIWFKARQSMTLAHPRLFTGKHNNMFHHSSAPPIIVKLQYV